MASKIAIYLLRHDLRVADNPILHHLATAKEHGFTHLLPVYIFPAHQIEVSGFIRNGSKSPYPEARSQIGGFWRCGPHRCKFIAQSVWNMKESLQGLHSDLCLRAGKFDDVLKELLDGFAEKEQNVGAVWMTAEEGVEEKRDERAVSSLCSRYGVDFKAWQDEKYFIDDRDTDLKDAKELPDVFTSYRKTQEPLRNRPRAALPAPSSLLPFPDVSSLPPAQLPFEMPTTYADLEASLLAPITDLLKNPPAYPEGTESVHPFAGGEDDALKRLTHLVKGGFMSSYKDTRNGLLGTDFSTKLSGYLAMGCLTARQIHEMLLELEDGTNEDFKDAQGYGQGENDGTKAVRFELLWRDYMRLCTRKFGPKLFRLSGFREDEKPKWKTTTGENSNETSRILERFLTGTVGMGLIDASQRELFHTGYTSNRARQNVASFLTKHLGIDWRYGAEWYECLLIDYDVNSNWSNWQYVAGVGNDPRGEARIFNPVKQAFDYDKEGKYVKAWVPEVRVLENLENVFQVWTTPHHEVDRAGLLDDPMVRDPVKKIEFSVEGKPKGPKRPYIRRRGRGGVGNGNNTGDDAEPVLNTIVDGSSQYHSRQDVRSSLPNGTGQGYRGNGNFRGVYRGYRSRGPGGPRGGRRTGYGGGGRGRPHGEGMYPTPSSAPMYMAPSQPRPYWTTTNPGRPM